MPQSDRTSRSGKAPKGRLKVSVTPKGRAGKSRMRVAVAGRAKGLMRMRAVHLVCAAVFLLASLLGTLLLRTQMVEDSFAITSTQQSIARLTQDIQEQQIKLDDLESQLPDKAQQLGMVPGTDALTIDLQGYSDKQDSAEGNR